MIQLNQSAIFSYIGNISDDCESKKLNIRERVWKNGIECATTEELIMLILGSGTKERSVAVIAKDVLSCISKCDPECLFFELKCIKGISLGKAAAIMASLELGRRNYGMGGTIIKKPKDLIPLVQHYTLESREHFLCITLNGAHEIIKIREISVGSLNRSLIHPREVFVNVLKDHAAAIIICHNHPSGRTEPSENDIEITARLKDCADLLGITLLDHLIIGKESYYSFSSACLL
ncbi:MAG: DNA repair protein RadC [Treponema sp.]|jgi:DNA repair protein RadC|nr:DNA repair protein RadC [Treponema sp.]